MKSQYLIAQTLGHTTGAHIALFTGDPTTAPELDAAGYARQPGAFTVSGNTATLEGVLVYGPAGEAWGTVTHVALFDAATGGNMLWMGTFDAPKTVQIGDKLELPSGDGLTVEET